MQTLGTFEKIETEYLGLCILNINRTFELKDWVYILIDALASHNNYCVTATIEQIHFEM